MASPDARITPLKLDRIGPKLREFKIIFTRLSFLAKIGSIIAEIIAENQLAIKLIRLGVTQCSDGLFGNTEFMHQKHGISYEHILRSIDNLD